MPKYAPWRNSLPTSRLRSNDNRQKDCTIFLPDGLCHVKTISDLSALIGVPVEAFNLLDASDVLPTPCRSPSCSLPSINPLQEIRRRTQRGRRGDNKNNDNDNNNPQPSNPNNTNEGNTNGEDPWETSFFGGKDEEKKSRMLQRP